MKPVLFPTPLSEAFVRLSALRNLFRLVLAVLLPITAQGADPFAENVRTTDPLKPAEAQKAFRLPAGFEIQLVAAEPDILKPMNMAFDEKGRLWVTVTQEYPYAAPLDRKGRDAIVILEDSDNDGRAEKITTFADGLNIPTGIYPYKGGVIAWSIPNIWHFQDTDGDGKADKREVLFGPLGYERDTHGMNSSFRRGFDGWLYATHGYNNVSTVRGRDGSEIKMNSGNTYRVQVDGSRVEQHTYGQVNPFGLCFDPLGNLYSADCHSAPIYQLIHGGTYPSFGKPHDGLGFAPTMLEHTHGSTAIAGVLYYGDSLFPLEFRDNLFIGNVMTSVLNRDSVTERGSTKVATEMPDFVRTEDPWFRPVDIQLGPDGAVYIADFYNRIIGHYEVPLTHPGRDRTSGRIWRVVYRGPDGKQNARPRRDLSVLNAENLLASLADPNLTFRMLAMNELTDRVGSAAVAPVKSALRRGATNEFQVAHGLWVLHRLDALDTDLILDAARNGSRLVRTHAMRILAETKAWKPELRAAAVTALRDPDAFVQRTAAEALGRHPAFENVRPLIELRRAVASNDTHTLYAVRKALRDQLVPEENMIAQRESANTPDVSPLIADVAVGIKSGEAALYLLDYVHGMAVGRRTLAEYLGHIARHAPASGLERLARFSRERFGDDPDFQVSLYSSVEQGLQQRGSGLSKAITDWGAALARQLLASVEQSRLDWVNTPVEGIAESANPWTVQQRKSADGDKAAVFLSSLPAGETLTGVLRSQPFDVPRQLKFFMAGHDGFPDRPAQGKNWVRLVAADSSEVLMATQPPRNDLAQLVTWNLTNHAGRKAFLEIVDGDNASAYAWLAVGRFTPEVVKLPATAPSNISARRVAAAELAGKLRIEPLTPELLALLNNESIDSNARGAAAQALLRINPDAHLPAIGRILHNGAAPGPLREQIGKGLGELNAEAPRELLFAALRAAPQRMQSKLALALAGNAPGAEMILSKVATRELPPALLLERPVRDKILAANPKDAKGRLEELTRGLTPTDEKLQQLIDKRRQSFASVKSAAAVGQRLFTQNCAACHQIGGQGGLIGPQLDGIGSRGLDRVLEDILDPNRNVDRAFRSTLFVLKDGDIVSGLFRRDEGELAILADSTGKEISVPRKEISERKESETSLMPENFGEILSPDDFNQLVAYLLAQRATPQ